MDSGSYICLLIAAGLMYLLPSAGAIQNKKRNRTAIIVCLSAALASAAQDKSFRVGHYGGSSRSETGRWADTTVCSNAYFTVCSGSGFQPVMSAPTASLDDPATGARYEFGVHGNDPLLKLRPGTEILFRTETTAGIVSPTGNIRFRSVSRRSPARSNINVWTSRNIALGLSKPNVLDEALQRIGNRESSREALASIAYEYQLSELEIAKLSQLLELLFRDAGLPWDD